MNAALRLSPLLDPQLQKLLVEAIRGGEIERAYRSIPGYPLHYPGQAAYAERCLWLDRLLLPRGWTRSDPDLQVVFTSPCGKFRLVTMAGDPNTGREGSGPKTRRKGPRTREAVRHNRRLSQERVQLRLFGKVEAEDPLTLFLLVSQDRRRGRLRAELSLPIKAVQVGSQMQYEWLWREFLLDEESNPRRNQRIPTTVDFDLEER